MVLLLSSLLPDDRMTMSVLPVNCEIVELTETPYCESKISGSTGKQPWLKKPIEEDIDKLFEAIGRGSFCRRRFANLSYKTAMKRSMRVIPPQVLSIGISDSISLKQALRGLCISQASEMAAAKKRSCKPSASEAGAIWKLHWAVGPKSGSSKISTKALEYEHLAEFSDKREVFVLPKDVSLQSAEITESGTVAEIATFETRHGSEHEETLELPDSSFGMDKQVPKSCKILPTPGKSSVQDKSKFTSLSSNDNVGVEIVKGSKLGSMKLNMLVKNFVKKKMATKEFLEDERSRSAEKGNSSQSSKNSTIGECSSTTSYSGESYPSTSTPNGYRHYMSGDLRWKAIGHSEKQHGKLSLKHFKLLRKVGAGDIGTVYVAQLIGTSCLFAIKVVDKELLISRKKLQRAQTEIEILEIVEHPFLPTLYAHLTTNKYSCLIMEYCPGGNLHMLRQNQLTKSFSEKATRFYVAEVVLALEYLHILGVVYRDLKPENILLGEDGHIMLSDFNSSVRCTVTPLLLNSSSPNCEPPKISSCIHPFCLQPSLQLSCFTSRELKSELSCQIIPLPQLVVEPTTIHSDFFVGTHEYLAPEIIKGECHGSAVDWWTVGILLYELIYGTTPFTGASNKDTINNVILQALKFPASPVVSSRARDLIRRLLKKEPETRLGSAKGAGEIKMHPFFEGLNWALIRCETPPELPKLSDTTNDEAKKNHGSRMREFREEFQCHEEDEFVMMFNSHSLNHIKM